MFDKELKNENVAHTKRTVASVFMLCLKAEKDAFLTIGFSFFILILFPLMAPWDTSPLELVLCEKTWR